MTTARASLPLILRRAIGELAHLGSTTQEFTEAALDRLWNDAAIRQSDGKVFILTGDIPAMWIRDSVWQVRPLLRFVGDAEVLGFVQGVIAAQKHFLAIDPYANAFNLEPNGNCWHKDFADQSPWVFERKFELDSITSFLQLSFDLREAAGSDAHLDGDWWRLARVLVELLWRETRHDPATYRFVRTNAPKHDYLSNDGYGAAYADCGLIWSAFRPSDDACELPFHVPSNIHAQLQLRRLAAFASAHDTSLAQSATRLANQLSAAIAKFAIVKHLGSEIYAYEVDGRGGAIVQDDANYPSLLSLPWLGIQRDETYRKTRALVLNAANPWFFSGEFGSGVGSPHTGENMIWPLAIAMQGLTEEQPATQLAALRLIERTRSKSGFIHESFDVADPEHFTRDWFSWAEMTYAELAFTIAGLDNASAL